MQTPLLLIERFQNWSAPAYVLLTIVVIAFLGILVNGLTQKGNK